MRKLNYQWHIKLQNSHHNVSKHQGVSRFCIVLYVHFMYYFWEIVKLYVIITRLFSFSGMKAKIEEHKKLVAQLQKEVSVKRIPVSQAAADLIKVTQI